MRFIPCISLVCRGSGLAVILAVFGAFGRITPAAGQAESTPQIRIPDDATVESLFLDFLHYARMGRFTLADAYARALLAHPDLDPVAVLEVANQDKKSVDALLILIESSTIGDNAARVLDLIHEGEHLKRQDAERIRDNIMRLGGSPQEEHLGTKYLMESGEYAIPLMLQTLLDPRRAEVRPRLVVALSRMRKPAVNPLVMALAVGNNDVRLHLIRALGEIGYPQAIPYLSKLIADPDMPAEVKTAAAVAIERISAITNRTFPGAPEEHFFHLAEKYYNEDDGVRADPRLPTANVWYWDDDAQALRHTVVEERLFAPVMAMRCCEEALRLRNDYPDALALWLAANVRRESRLGMDPESGDPSEAGNPDETRPPDFPRALYFTQSAGPRYAHLVLARAVRDHDTAVALGAIKALHITAGEASLVGSEDYKQPLVEALKFPDLIVRIRAALALGAALPRTPFADADSVMPILATTVALTGRDRVLVVDADEGNLNRVAEVLRGVGCQVVRETSFYRAMQRARSELQAVGAVFLSTSITEPDFTSALRQLRSEFVYSQTPVVIMTTPPQLAVAEGVCDIDRWAECVDAAVDGTDLTAAWERVRTRTGQTSLNADLAEALVLEAVDTLRRIAVDGRTVYDLTVAEPALQAALSSPNDELQRAAVSVLALTPTETAQRAIATMALEEVTTPPLRLAAFASLAESVKNHGNLLRPDQITELVSIAGEDRDLNVRTAASQALGAVNLRTNEASEIIRSYCGG